MVWGTPVFRGWEKRLAKDIKKEEPVRWKENQKTEGSGKCDEKEGVTSYLRRYWSVNGRTGHCSYAYSPEDSSFHPIFP